MNPMGKKELRIMVRIKLAMSRATEAYTMACMVDLPTPTAPFVVFSPSRQEMVEMMSLDQGYEDVPHGDEFAHEVHPVGLVYVKGGDADNVRGGDAHQIGFHHQDGHGNKHGLYPRLHQVVYRIHIHGFKGIHLFRDLHGADFLSHFGSDAPSSRNMPTATTAPPMVSILTV